jgi:signal transduction histidine kinase
MFTEEMQEACTRLEVILALIQAGDSEGALTEIRDLVSALRTSSSEEPDSPDGPPQITRVIAAHLKAAEVQIEQTHLSPAEDSVAKAIYAASHPAGQASGAQLNV